MPNHSNKNICEQRVAVAPFMLAPSSCACRIPCRFPSCRSERQAPSRHSRLPVNKVTFQHWSGESVSRSGRRSWCLLLSPRCSSSLTVSRLLRIAESATRYAGGPRCQGLDFFFSFCFFAPGYRVLRSVPACAGATGKWGLNCTHPEHKAQPEQWLAPPPHPTPPPPPPQPNHPKRSFNLRFARSAEWLVS